MGEQPRVAVRVSENWDRFHGLSGAVAAVVRAGRQRWRHRVRRRPGTAAGVVGPRRNDGPVAADSACFHVAVHIAVHQDRRLRLLALRQPGRQLAWPVLLAAAAAAAAAAASRVVRVLVDLSLVRRRSHRHRRRNRPVVRVHV